MNAKWIVLSLVSSPAIIFWPCIPHAQQYPSSSIRFIVPASPGGGTDFFARIIGQKLSETWGQQVIVDNRPGAAGNIAATFVAKSSADGYTINIVGMGHSVTISLYRAPGFDPVRDFAPITLVAEMPSFLVVHPSLPVKSVKELVALAKANPGKLNYSSGGNGNPGHLSGELLKMLAGIQVVHVPYGAGVASTLGVVRGEAALEFNNLLTVDPHIKSGKLKVLAAAGSKRAVQLPEVPTIAESGVPGYELVQWYGVLAPAGTPRPIVDRINTEMVKILKLPDVRERFFAIGADPIGNRPEEFDALIKSEITKWAKVIKEAGMRID